MYAVIVWVGHQIKTPAKKEEVDGAEEKRKNQLCICSNWSVHVVLLNFEPQSCRLYAPYEKFIIISFLPFISIFNYCRLTNAENISSFIRRKCAAVRTGCHVRETNPLVCFRNYFLLFFLSHFSFAGNECVCVCASSCEHFSKFSQANICSLFVSFYFKLHTIFIFAAIKMFNSYLNMNFNLRSAVAVVAVGCWNIVDIVDSYLIWD